MSDVRDDLVAAALAWKQRAEAAESAAKDAERRAEKAGEEARRSEAALILDMLGADGVVAHINDQSAEEMEREIVRHVRWLEERAAEAVKGTR